MLRVLLDLALWCAALGVLGVVVVHLLGLDEWRHTVAVLALTPYALGAALVLLLVTLLARRAVLAGVATALVLALAVPVLPRLLPDGQPTAAGHPLVVASVNLHVGRGTDGLVELVRDHRVDVLSLQELTPASVAALDAAGLAEELPYRVFYTAPAVLGSGIASRHPAQQRVLLPPSTIRQPAVHVALPDGAEVEVQLVHPVQPLGQHGNEKWRAELAELPRPRTDGVPRLLVGDFNSTLDHPALRRVLATGYVDAAEQVGAGLLATWPTDRGLWPPPVAIDHVLADPRCSVRSFEVVDVPHTDHRAVIATLTLP